MAPTKEELEEKAEAAGVTDADDKTKAELEDAIEELEPGPSLDKKTGKDDSGRPPLRKVAEASASGGARVREIVTPKGDEA